MPETQVQISVPGNHLMVALLGQRDELLRLIEGAFDASIHVRARSTSPARCGITDSRPLPAYPNGLFRSHRPDGHSPATMESTCSTVVTNRAPGSVWPSSALKRL